MSQGTAPRSGSVPIRRTGNEVHVGDRLDALRIDVTPRTVVMGASASRDWQPQHHDHVHCTQVANLPDIFLNTPHQAGYMERYLTDWGGPHARLAKLGFRMKQSIIPGDTMVFSGLVTEVVEDGDVVEVTVEVEISIDDVIATSCTARVALPATEDDNPWHRRGPDWTP